MTTQNHYTFGDGERAARRLSLLARAFEAPSRALLGQFRPEGLELALDLGCGPGHTTRLVHEVARPRRTIGLEASNRYLQQAREAAEPNVEFLQADVTAPVGVPAARLVFSRFLLTHVSDPTAALCAFRSLVEPGGVLILQETASMQSSHPALARYYALVGELQAHYDQTLYIGRELARRAAGTPFDIVYSGVRHIEQAAPIMAEIHLPNLQTWRTDPFARASFDSDELNHLEKSLQRIVSGEEAAAPVAIGVGELVLQ
jgi:SAM-dependent methyltransferase